MTYRPDLALLARLLDALAEQVGAVVVVDNASPGAGVRETCAVRAQVELLALPGNRGLAVGLNAGIARARLRARVTHVLLMDQDSVPEPGMVPTLLAAFADLSRSGRVGAVGPNFHDPREGSAAPFVRFGFPFNHKLDCNGGSGVIACDFLITSGCLIPLDVLDTVGDMDGDLFIDNVDLEWCFRAHAAGLGLYGVCGAHMRHRLGDQRARVPGVPRGIIVHGPLRLYYMMRNRVLLYHRSYTPRRWIAQDVPRALVKLLVFALLPPRRKNLRCMLAGLAAGAAGRADPPPDGV
ncbi:MAG TPA: glycosyltransferase family 2 protein [Rhodanobacteraceae bacterium]